jgi:hypothetical protein
MFIELTSVFFKKFTTKSIQLAFSKKVFSFNEGNETF